MEINKLRQLIREALTKILNAPVAGDPNFSANPNQDSSGATGKRRIPFYFPMEKDAIDLINKLGEQTGTGQHIKVLRKPARQIDPDVVKRGRKPNPNKTTAVVYISPLMRLALGESTRGRTTRDTEKKKTALAKLASEKLSSSVKGLLKKHSDPKPVNMPGLGPMHEVKHPTDYDISNGTVLFINPQKMGGMQENSEFQQLKQANAKVVYFLSRNNVEEKDLKDYRGKLEQLAGEYAYALDGFLKFYYHTDDVAPSGTNSDDYFRSLL